ncbi:MAG: polysaccharide biosynthesis C-terminal domain-containing protein [Rectinemataceae bacterium]|nr:polysaccharide biosynthesis C-terminal domain-containing protein [Rectinemataceae bacterium]
MKAVFQVFSFDLASKVLLGILGMLLIRYLPLAEYAAYTLALSLVAFSSQSLVASFNRIYIVAYQKLRLKNTEMAFLALQLLLIAGLILLGIPLSFSLGSLYWIIAALAAANCLSEFSKTFFQQNLKFLTFSLIEFCRSLLFFCCTLLLIQLQKHELTAGAVLLIQTAALLGVSWWAIGKKLTSLKSAGFLEIAHFSTEIMKGEYRYLFAYFFILGIFTQTDIFMLGILGDNSMLATYGSAFRYYSILSLALGSVHVVLLPMIQQASNDQELFEVFSKHKKMILMFIPAVLLAGWLAQWFIPFIDDGKYPGAVLSFRILCVSAIISFAFSPHVNLIMRFERFRFLFRLICIALVLNVAINMLLIPKFGAAGVAFATLISAAAVTIPIYFRSKKLVAEHFSHS